MILLHALDYVVIFHTCGLLNEKMIPLMVITRYKKDVVTQSMYKGRVSCFVKRKQQFEWDKSVMHIIQK